MKTKKPKFTKRELKIIAGIAKKQGVNMHEAARWYVQRGY